MVTERIPQTNNKYPYFTLKFRSQGWRLTDSPASIPEGAEEAQEGCSGAHPEAQTCAVLHLPSLDRDKDMGNRDKQSLVTAQLAPSVDPVGHME